MSRDPSEPSLPFDLAPWQCLNIIGAILTGGLFFYSDHVNMVRTLAKERDPSAAPEDAQIAPRLLRMVRLRDLCAIFYILLAFGYAFLALEGIDKEPLADWLAPLHFLYGPYL
uniref:Uncharacterized protein n=1 Tax=Candidatus Kentrum sp. SD TaxID=2126332 RepID=A0A450Z658_9GAMM|nr:MAG: hypothetical protein BECKSD772F_GA0070984_11635 [Candidatus Kentron sp. SD]VFK49300.1 MAG: hypothetical protein BECKSD772E_GA0070983_11705 [Candidatus Kentron sp. SD]VFK79175.1 MAG: hypothetical protein BECKSD772D_GA0070982_103822 [Candidatus Kentron sp. SD]